MNDHQSRHAQAQAKGQFLPHYKVAERIDGTLGFKTPHGVCGPFYTRRSAELSAAHLRELDAPDIEHQPEHLQPIITPARRQHPRPTNYFSQAITLAGILAAAFALAWAATWVILNLRQLP